MRTRTRRILAVGASLAAVAAGYAGGVREVDGTFRYPRLAWPR